MKSKRAEEYLKEHLSDFPLLGVYYAIKAAELAEADMIEKAGRVFAEYCEMYAGNGKCLEGGECATCARIREFKQKLMEIQNK